MKPSREAASACMHCEAVSPRATPYGAAHRAYFARPGLAFSTDVLRATAARMSALNAPASTSSPSWMSIARRTFPSRLALKSLAGSCNAAPWAKVNFTLDLYDSPVQMIPSCAYTGVPIHFHSSTTSGSASLMSLRILLKVFPRQSPSSAMRFEMSSDADWLWLAPDFFKPALACDRRVHPEGLRSPKGDVRVKGKLLSVDEPQAWKAARQSLEGNLRLELAQSGAQAVVDPFAKRERLRRVRPLEIELLRLREDGGVAPRRRKPEKELRPLREVDAAEGHGPLRDAP